MIPLRTLVIPADPDEAMEICFVEGIESLHDIVGGYVERVLIGNFATQRKFNCVMLVNESGALVGLPVNRRAGFLYGTPLSGVKIYGNVVLIGEAWEDFDNLSDSYTPETIERYLTSFDDSGL